MGGNAIVASLTQLATNLGLRTIAEGIETTDEHDLLREYGCRYGQGFLLARPMPGAAHTALIAASQVA